MSALPTLTAAQVRAIRTQGLTDEYWARKLGKNRHVIRKARMGLTCKWEPTPPDTAPREGAGRNAGKLAKAARLRRSTNGEDRNG